MIHTNSPLDIRCPVGPDAWVNMFRDNSDLKFCGRNGWRRRQAL